MQVHAKSFHLASLFFPRDVLYRVRALYALCRWIDDAADLAPSVAVARERLHEIREDLFSSNSQMEVNQLYKAHGLTLDYIEDLIEGVSDDLSTVRMQDEEELIQYCYKVAGCVGLAMSDLMGVTEPSARAFAVDLGIGMQMTNIARDVLEDAKNDRVYLPQTLLARHGLSHEDILQFKCKPSVMKEFLSLADTYYTSARLAYPSIPLRARGAICVAGELYRAIGTKLLRKGGDPMQGRTMLHTGEKIVYLGKGLSRWLLSAFSRPQLTHETELHQALKPWRVKRGFSQ